MVSNVGVEVLLEVGLVHGIGNGVWCTVGGVFSWILEVDIVFSNGVTWGPFF